MAEHFDFLIIMQSFCLIRTATTLFFLYQTDIQELSKLEKRIFVGQILQLIRLSYDLNSLQKNSHNILRANHQVYPHLLLNSLFQEILNIKLSLPSNHTFKILQNIFEGNILVYKYYYLSIVLIVNLILNVQLQFIFLQFVFIFCSKQKYCCFMIISSRH